MEKKFKLGVIGAGFMASAIINGIIASKVLAPHEIINSDVSEEALQRSSQKGVEVTVDNKTVVNNSEYVLFAVKPQSLSSVMESLAATSCEKSISIMAGVKKSKIKSFFPQAQVARCMPNTPCSIKRGAIGIDLSDYNSRDKKFIKSLFRPLAKVVEVDEDKLNAVTGVSGSSPAYFYLFLKGIIMAGVKNGLSYEDAKSLAVHTMRGSAEMVIKNKNKSIDELINAVCSKGGTTIEAVNIFETNQQLNSLIEEAVDACVNRSFELENL